MYSKPKSCSARTRSWMTRSKGESSAAPRERQADVCRVDAPGARRALDDGLFTGVADIGGSPGICGPAERAMPSAASRRSLRCRTAGLVPFQMVEDHAADPSAAVDGVA